MKKPLERPIPFTGRMVNAVYAGHKTQTRRIIRKQPTLVKATGDVLFPWAHFYGNGVVHTFDRNGNGGENWNRHGYNWENPFAVALEKTPYVNPSPYGLAGDLLYVRETWAVPQLYQSWSPINLAGGFWPKLPGGKMQVFYRAGRSSDSPERKWKPSIHMPKEFSRLWLRNISVRVEQLQDISDEDALAEGVSQMLNENAIGVPMTLAPGDTMPRTVFRQLWDDINGKRPGGSWEDNPWVWVVEFEPVKRP